MSHDEILRTIAVIAAAALLAAPHWRHFARLGAAAAEAVRVYGVELSRIAAAGLILAAAWGVMPMPTLPVAPAVAIEVPEPSGDLKRLVEPVRASLASLSANDRALWAATWSKAAIVAEAEGATSVTVFPDTASLRAFTATVLDIAWRRIGGHQPGGVAGLKESVETAMQSSLGLDVVPVTAQVRGRYAETARAIAWAATGG